MGWRQVVSYARRKTPLPRCVRGAASEVLQIWDEADELFEHPAVVLSFLEKKKHCLEATGGTQEMERFEKDVLNHMSCTVAVHAPSKT